MADIEKQKMISMVLLVLLIMSVFVIGVLINASNMINDLDKVTIESLSQCVVADESTIDYNEYINEVLTTYENEKQKIDQKNINNGLTSFLITLIFILTSIKRIIRTLKSIGQEIFNGKTQNKNEVCSDPTLALDKEKLLIKISEYRKLKDAIERLELGKNKDQQQDEQIMKVEEIILGILDDFASIMGQTSSYTKQIKSDKEQLLLGIEEIQKGMEQISHVINHDDIENNTVTKEELMAALEQINTGMKETEVLIGSIDKKIKGLSTYIEHYK